MTSTVISTSAVANETAVEVPFEGRADVDTHVAKGDPPPGVTEPFIEDPTLGQVCVYTLTFCIYDICIQYIHSIQCTDYELCSNSNSSRTMVLVYHSIICTHSNTNSALHHHTLF
jgi:hypothetical protein